MAIKKITDIYQEYFQKSKVFLYPALGNRKGSGVTPIETYLEWGDIKVDDRKLICLYHLRDDDEFLDYEDRNLLGNPLFEDYKEVNKDKAVYIFNFDEHKEDYDNVINGKYSQLSQQLKNRIRDVYGGSSANYAYIKSYLYPDDYFEEYAKMLSPQEIYVKEMHEILKGVGELCSKPNFEKEKLKISVNSLKLGRL